MAWAVPPLTAAAADAPEPRVKWRHATAGWGEPAADRDAVYYLGRHHELIALDAAGGRLRWRVGTGGAGDAPVGSAVRIAGGLVIAGDGAIVAVHRNDGRLAWRFAPKGDAPGPYLGDTAGDGVLVGSIAGRLYALDAGTGLVRWTARPAGTRQALIFAPIESAGRVIVTFAHRSGRPGGGVAVFDRDGRRLWHRLLPAGVAATGPPAAVGRLVVAAGSDGTLRAWDAGTGRPSWDADGAPATRLDQSQLDLRPIVTVGGLVVAGSTTGRLTAYDGRTGAQAWTYSPPVAMAVLRLRADASTVYAPYTDDSLHAIDAVTGDVRWRAGGASLRLEWPPAAANGLVFAAGLDTLIAWHPSSDAGGGAGEHEPPRH